MLPSAEMRSFVAVVPTLNEEPVIAGTLRSIRAAGFDRIIVSDGGSRDATCTFAAQEGAEVLRGSSNRGEQINRALALVDDESVVVVVHADTLLPAEARAAIESALARGAKFGGFRVSFIENRLRLRVAESMINLRSRFLREPWGDQAQWFVRATARSAGDYPSTPILEDYSFAQKMRRGVKCEIVRATVRTSGRRFLQKGLLTTALINWTIITRFHLGTDPAVLASIYRRGDNQSDAPKNSTSASS